MDECPQEVTDPCPVEILRALVVVSCTWGWWTFARYLCHRFYGVHRGIDLAELKRMDIVLPFDRQDAKTVLYTRVRNKSQWRGGPKRQHSAIEVGVIAEFIARGCAGLMADDLVYPYSYSTIRHRWRKLLEALGLDPDFLDLRALRGGGCVWLFEETRDLPFVQWRGRWQDMKTVVHYLQESLVHSWHLRLSAKARKRILMLQNMFERVIA